MQRKGWINKSSSGWRCLTKWKPKWAVLYDRPAPILQLFDQRNDLQPKYTIRIAESRLFDGSAEAKRTSLNNNPFIVFSSNRKVYNYRFHAVYVGQQQHTNLSLFSVVKQPPMASYGLIVYGSTPIPQFNQAVYCTIRQTIVYCLLECRMPRVFAVIFRSAVMPVECP